MRPLTIALVVGSLRVGGTEAQAIDLAAGLRARGHDAHMVAIAGGGPLEDRARAAGVPLRVFGHGGLRLRDAAGWRSPRVLAGEVRTLLALWRHLRRLRADACHTFNFTCNTLALPIARAAGIRVRVNGRRGASPASPTGLTRRFLDLMSRLSSTVYVCNSRAGARALEGEEGVPAARITVIENSVCVPASAADVARQPPRGVVVANLYAYKGHADLLDALASLDAPPRVCLVGDGPERDAIAARVRAYGLEGAVELAGAVPDASRLLTGYQFAVLPSHQEGLPNAVLEAMAAGLPVIATAVGGVPEILANGVTGLLVRPHAPAELAAAIARLTADAALRVRLGAAARRAAALLGPERAAARHESVYRR